MPRRSEHPRHSSLRRLGTGLVLLLTLSLSLPAAAQTPTPPGGPGPNRKYDATHIKLAEGYRIEPVVINLSVPTTAVFDGPDLLVAESGWANTAPARILRITPDWQVTVVITAGLEGPVTGLLVHDGQLYISHKSKVSVVEPGGTLRDIVTGLPSFGDHQNNNLVRGPDGKIYLGQGTVTNAAVVGVDNYIFGWLADNPTVHEIPCRDITLVGVNFESENPLTTDPNDKVTTGAYKPFGTASQPGEVIKGQVKCGGSIARFNPDGSGYEVVAWGLRNPYGLEFDRDGQLWATYHGADVRGSRNIFNDPDYLVQVEEGAWYGWPDYFAGELVTADRFNAPTKAQPPILWRDHPPLTKPFAMFETHEGINGLAFSPGGGVRLRRPRFCRHVRHVHPGDDGSQHPAGRLSRGPCGDADGADPRLRVEQRARPILHQPDARLRPPFGPGVRARREPLRGGLGRLDPHAGRVETATADRHRLAHLSGRGPGGAPGWRAAGGSRAADRTGKPQAGGRQRARAVSDARVAARPDLRRAPTRHPGVGPALANHAAAGPRPVGRASLRSNCHWQSGRAACDLAHRPGRVGSRAWRDPCMSTDSRCRLLEREVNNG